METGVTLFLEDNFWRGMTVGMFQAPGIILDTLQIVTSALNVETSAFGAATSTTERRSFDATISAIDAERSSLGAATSAIAWSYRRYRCGVSGDVGDCGVGITPQMCNRVTNHGDMSTFSKPETRLFQLTSRIDSLCKQFTFKVGRPILIYILQYMRN